MVLTSFLCSGICPNGTFGQNGQCISTTQCPPGTMLVAPATSSSNRVCQTCPAGTSDISGNASAPCFQCPAGGYTPAMSVGPCSLYVCNVGTADLDDNPATPCQPCDGVTDYQGQPGQTFCNNVTVCGPGYQELRPPTAFSDRVCSTCIPGQTFRTGAFNTSLMCQPVTVCQIGEAQSIAPTATRYNTQS